MHVAKKFYTCFLRYTIFAKLPGAWCALHMRLYEPALTSIPQWHQGAPQWPHTNMMDPQLTACGMLLIYNSSLMPFPVELQAHIWPRTHHSNTAHTCITSCLIQKSSWKITWLHWSGFPIAWYGHPVGSLEWLSEDPCTSTRQETRSKSAVACGVSAVGFFCPGQPQITAETPTRQVHYMLLPVHWLFW